MLASVIYIIGIIAAVWCVLDIFKHNNLDLLWKIVLCVAVLATSWIGLLAYYFIIRDRI